MKYSSIIQLLKQSTYVTDFAHVRPKRQHKDKTEYFGYAIFNAEYKIILQLNKLLNVEIPVVSQLSYKSIGMTIGFYRVTGLSLPKRKLQSLPSEILHFPALRKLLLQKNSLHIFPEQISAPLQFLDLSHNALTTFAFSGEYLLSLNLQGNQLSTFPKLKTPLLKQLILARNELIELPDISHLSTLKQLNIAHNSLHVLPPSLANLQLLEILNVAHNHLANFDLSALSTLRVLYAQSNELVTFPSLPVTLELFNVANNSIPDIPDLYLPNLQVLKIAMNKISLIPPHLFQLPIRELFLGGNPISSFPAIENSILKKLYVEHTEISELQLSDFINLQLVFVKGLQLVNLTIPDGCKVSN